MAAALDEALEEDAARAEAALAKTHDTVILATKFVFIPADFHADSTTAGSALQHDGVAELFGGDDGCMNVI